VKKKNDRVTQLSYGNGKRKERMRGVANLFGEKDPPLFSPHSLDTANGGRRAGLWNSLGKGDSYAFSWSTNQSEMGPGGGLGSIVALAV